MQRRGATSEIYEVANASFFSSAPRTGAYCSFRFRLRGVSGPSGRRLVLLPSLPVLEAMTNPSGADASEGRLRVALWNSPPVGLPVPAFAKYFRPDNS